MTAEKLPLPHVERRECALQRGHLVVVVGSDHRTHPGQDPEVPRYLQTCDAPGEQAWCVAIDVVCRGGGAIDTHDDVRQAGLNQALDPLGQSVTVSDD